MYMLFFLIISQSQRGTVMSELTIWLPSSAREAAHTKHPNKLIKNHPKNHKNQTLFGLYALQVSSFIWKEDTLEINHPSHPTANNISQRSRADPPRWIPAQENLRLLGRQVSWWLMGGWCLKKSDVFSLWNRKNPKKHGKKEKVKETWLDTETQISDTHLFCVKVVQSHTNSLVFLFFGSLKRLVFFPFIQTS